MTKLRQNLKLTRKDGKIIDVIYYNLASSSYDNSQENIYPYDNFGINKVEILDIKKLKFEGMKTKDIKKANIRDIVFKGEEKLYLQNKESKIVANLPRKHLTKIISTLFTRDVESRHTYLKKEIISNIDTIFYAAIPILIHPELKSEILYDCQIVHRLALPLKIGGVVFLVMITVKERIDFQEKSIDEFAIYDLYSETQENKNPLGSSSTASVGDYPMTTRSQYQMDTYSIDDLIDFVNLCVKKNYG